MAESDSAKFLEILRQQRKHSQSEQGPQAGDVDGEFEAPSAPDLDSSPVLTNSDLESIHTSDFEVGNEAGESPTDLTVSSIHVEVPGNSGELSEDEAWNSSSDGLYGATASGSSLPSSRGVGLAILFVIGISGAYMLGVQKGKRGGTPWLSDSASPALSITKSRPASESDALPGNGKEKAGPAGRTVSQKGVAWALILKKYEPTQLKEARAALERLQEDGYVSVRLAKDSRNLFLYCGKFPARDHPSLEKYKTLFSSMPEFRNCFVKPILAK